MQSKEFVLSSGVKLKVTVASFEIAVALVESVKKASAGVPSGTDIGDAIIISPEVRKALFAAFDTVLYGHTRVTQGLFDDPEIGDKARSDYFEMAGIVIRTNMEPFFLNSSKSITKTQQVSESLK